ncbi:MAG TPA: tetratricopeptide repeat protein [Polyangiales bacterium]|nr:tetratricopeptide repeat protein [Polyangiales bacterium]
MSCPDNLLIGYRRGALSDEEQARLDGHLGGCPTCRLTLQVGADFDGVLGTVPGDDLIAARFARNLASKVQPAGAARRSGKRRVAWVAIAAIAVTASAGLAAARLGAWPFAAPAARPPASPSASADRAAQPARKPIAQAEPALPVTELSSEPAAIERATPESAPRAAELFAQANARRREGEPKRARGLYRQLQQLYPRSPEVEVSHVSLGRVHLELGEARDALEQFERYLAKRPGGPLAEEALFGQASALERLGWRAAERTTWQKLLAVYPSSVYADRARHRLERIP